MRRLLINKRELKKFKGLLIKKKQEILSELEHIAQDALKKSQRDASGDISGYTYHMADLATDTYDREFSLDLASSEREILYQVDEAIKRIDEGTYGKCLDCGKPIAKVRLKAVPYARFCKKCQQKWEKR